MSPFEHKNTELIKEFNRYVREHPGIADQIPNDAVLIFQLAGDDAFNIWARQLAKSHESKGGQVIFVKITKLQPIRSRIETLELHRVGG